MTMYSPQCKRRFVYYKYIFHFLAVPFVFMQFLIHSYNVQWYIAPLHVQKVLLFLLQKGSKTLHLHLGGIFVLSFEFFAMVNVNVVYCVKHFCVYLTYFFDSRHSSQFIRRILFQLTKVSLSYFTVIYSMPHWCANLLSDSDCYFYYNRQG